MVSQLILVEAGMLTIWPTQFTHSWGERLVVPLIAFTVLGYLPVVLVHHFSLRIFAAAKGQCMLFTRNAYQQVGGHAAVKDKIVEDVALAQRVKTHQVRLHMVEGNRLVSCQMYPGGWKQVRDGFAKNLLARHGNSVIALLGSMVFHWLVFVLPWIWLTVGGSWWALSLDLIGTILRALTAAFTQQRIIDALWMPISVLLMTRIAIQAITWRWQKKASWKGRNLHPYW